MKSSLFLLFLVMIAGCSTIKNEREFRSKNIILRINEYDSSYFLKTISTQTLDTVYIVSLKQGSEAGLKSKTVKIKEFSKIKVGDTIEFNLDQLMFTAAGKMEQLGLFLIVDNDTLWRGPKFIPNKFYKSTGTVGLQY